MGVVRFFHFIFFFALLLLPSESSAQTIRGSTNGVVVMGGRRILGFEEVPDSEGKQDEAEASDSISLPVKKKKQDKEVSDSSSVLEKKKKKEKEAPDSSFLLEKKAPKEALGSGSVLKKKTKEALDSDSVSEKKVKLEQPIIKQVVKVKKPTNGSTTTSAAATLLKKKTPLNHTNAQSKPVPPTGLKPIKKQADLLKTVESKNKTKVEKKTLGAASDAGDFQIIKKKPDASISTSTSSATPTKKKAPATPEKKKDPKEKETQIKLKKTKEVYSDDEDDLIQDFRGLPYKLQETFIPDLERISTTSKAYLNRANREMVEGFKPLVGHRYAPVVATVTSYIFLLLPLLLVSLLFHQIREYLSLQRLLFFIHGYLGAYFTVLTLTFAFTRVEPLRFFYQYSMTSYINMQVMQTLFYVMYLLMLVLYMVVQFSTATGLWVRVSALVQTMVGAVVGLHYYSAVFHNALAHKPPRASWRSHAVYAFCFLMLSLLAKRVIDRSKKAYHHESGEGDKQN
ncbi:uncharacterized protein LOC116259398 [Nymphaea colorata]|uniref:Uncharacterized protein n=1 Tax=Nymphaea colorata TaxID=210225 RepID=A0A5K1FVD7_9MAGN|nr:uncharacterized protein LOC116259398 [Nymphaea colorata]